MKFTLFTLVLFVVTAFGVYRPALDHGFVTDDHIEIVKNDFVKSWRHIPRLFSPSYITDPTLISLAGQTDIGSGSISYRPVTTLTYFFDYFLGKLNPFGYHLTNVVLLIMSSFLIYVLSLRMFSLSPLSSAIAGLLFLLHPVNSEVTAVITSRDDSLAFIFFALAMIWYLVFREQGYQKRSLYWGSLFCFVLGVFSKEMVITLPLILILYDYFFPSPVRTKIQDRVPIYTGYFLVSAVYFVIWVFVAPPIRNDIVDYFAGRWDLVFGTLIQIVAVYIKWMVWPFHIPAVLADDGIVVRNFTGPVFLNSLLIICCAVVLFVISVLKKRSKIVFSLLWIAMTLVPVLVLPYMLNVLYAARFLYIPMVGFCLLLALIFEASQKNILSRLISWVVLIIITLIYSTQTLSSLPRWKDNLSLSLNRQYDFPQNMMVYMSIAQEYENRGMLNEAMEVCQQALAIDDHCIECYNQLGLLYTRLNRFKEAQELFQVAVTLDPSFEVSSLNYCIALGRLQKYPQAEACFIDLLKRKDASVNVYYNLGICYAQQKKYAQAQRVWEQGLKRNRHDQRMINALQRLSEKAIAPK